MSDERIDVLAVMDTDRLLADRLRARLPDEFTAEDVGKHYEESIQAKIAVSKLIDACRDALEAGNDGDWQSARNELTSALARVRSS